jgi:chemotaxis protein CheD
MENAFINPTPDNYFLGPGYVFLAAEPAIISTVLGSCVSVCLYDRKRKRGGMNRYRYPWVRDKRKCTAIYGNAAVIALIRMMVDDGSKKKNLEAQIIGGAHNPDYCEKDIGQENIRIAKQILKIEGVMLTSEDTGGNKGRKVVFNSCTNELAVFKVDRLRQSDWYPYDGDR